MHSNKLVCFFVTSTLLKKKNKTLIVSQFCAYSAPVPIVGWRKIKSRNVNIKLVLFAELALYCITIPNCICFPIFLNGCLPYSLLSVFPHLFILSHTQVITLLLISLRKFQLSYVNFHNLPNPQFPCIIAHIMSSCLLV